jgi:hypothetical protein
MSEGVKILGTKTLPCEVRPLSKFDFQRAIRTYLQALHSLLSEKVLVIINPSQY